jgi:hypothetical protein
MPTEPAAATPVDQQIEFRGVMEERNRKLFSIYEIATRRSTWIEFNRSVDGIRVEAYDDAQELITVAYQGKSRVLSLKGAAQKIITAEAASSKTVKIPETNVYHDKPFRIGHVHEETLIRRAVRRPAATPASPPIPATTAISR